MLKQQRQQHVDDITGWRQTHIFNRWLRKTKIMVMLKTFAYQNKINIPFMRLHDENE